MSDHDQSALHGDDAMAVALRRSRAAQAGHLGDEEGARAALSDEDESVRATGLRALVRMTKARRDDVEAATADVSPRVRRAAAELALRFAETGAATVDEVTALMAHLLDDESAEVVEAACFGLGELAPPAISPRLALVATAHPDALCRETAVAALGSLGEEEGLAAILAALADKAPVRRRAVIALSAFEGPEVDAALLRALSDRDWQVRQAAEDLSSPRGEAR
ncbi:MAG: HEAT repeat domain-containing protein [Acidimicrobiales bacterium]